MIITLIDKAVAKEGYRFTHLGGTKICQTCPLAKVCVDSLKINTTYIVSKVRPKQHICKICKIDNIVMSICEVEEATNILAVKNQKFLDNIVILREPLECQEILCENYDFCISASFNKPTKVKVLKTIKKISCPLEYDLVLIEAKKVN
ncbi:MAG: UPF0179 family protein [Candidatus Heimdallarchaeaceae archaeon]